MDIRSYHGTDIAPYYKKRPTNFGYGFIGGSYAIEISGCPWTCSNCWSGFGHRGRPPAFEWTPQEAIEHMLAGMKRNGMQAGRITGGEPAMWWRHMVGLIDQFIAQTTGKVMDIPGETGRRGVPMHFVIETNGSLTSLRKIDELQAAHGRACRRVFLHFGLKATDAAGLSELTGMPLKAAMAAHQRQLECLVHVAQNTEFDMGVSFLDKYTDRDAYNAIAAKLDELRPPAGDRGDSVVIDVLRFRPYRGTTRYYTPKRQRKGK
jgi:uncharacterized Fe-S cluster-containing radical SAM superfamily protein